MNWFYHLLPHAPSTRDHGQHLFSLLLLAPPPPTSTLFPYTTLFRSFHHLELDFKRPAQGHGGHHFVHGIDVGLFKVAAGQHHLRSEERTSELQSRENLVCRLLLEKEKQIDSKGVVHDNISVRTHTGA